MPGSFLHNPKLKIIKPGWKGNPVRNGRFLNLGKEPDHSMWLALRWHLTTNPQKADKKKDQWVPRVQDPKPFLKSNQDGMVWLGHATFFIRLGGVTFLTDPLFYGVSWLKRRVPFPVEVADLPPIDYVLLSHGHFDHCDKKSLQALQKGRSFQVLTSLKMGTLIRPWLKETQIQEAGWYQQFQLPQPHPSVYFLPAYHWHKRGLLDNDRILWGSFMLQTESHTLFFAGDSGYADHFKEIGALFPGIDTCVVGVGAYSPAFIMQASHTNPAEAVQAFRDLGAKTMVPMHFGTFDLSDEPASEPVQRLEQLQTAGEIPGQLKMLDIGEVLPFPA